MLPSQALQRQTKITSINCLSMCLYPMGEIRKQKHQLLNFRLMTSSEAVFRTCPNFLICFNIEKCQLQRG